MGLLVIASNYLVQFPVNYFNLEQVLTYNFFTPARRPLAAGDAGLETEYPEKICHDDDGHPPP